MVRYLLESTFYDFLITTLHSFSGVFDGGVVAAIASILLVVLIIVSVLRAGLSYENKLLKGVRKMNAFFSTNPYVNPDNLVELNTKMKAMPKTMRFCWQEYMLNRDKMPSEYINRQSCLDKADKSSGFGNAIQTCKTFTLMLAAFACLMAVVYYTGTALSTEELIEFALFLPALILGVGFLVVAIMQLKYASVTANLYAEFNDFVRYLNKACSTMPPFVDYEVLFTPKEIKEEIPVLQDYLEKKAFQEQKEAEEKAQAQDIFDKFDFNDLGVENAILLDRAMLECEKYFNSKRILTERLNAKEQEQYNFAKNFDEVTKDFERKAQAHRESMAQLNEQLNNTTIKIEANSIKKRYNDTQQKLQQLEKDYDLAQTRFKKQQDEFDAEIKVLSDEISSKKSAIEEAMKMEGKSYANKVYGIINSMIAAQNEPFFRQVEEEKQNLQAQVNNLSQTLATQANEIETRNVQIAELEKDLRLRLAQIEAIGNIKDYFASKEFRDRVVSAKKVQPMEELPEAFTGDAELKQKLVELEQALKESNAKQAEMQAQMQAQEASYVSKIKDYEAKISADAEKRKEEQAKANESLQKLQKAIEAEHAKVEQVKAEQKVQKPEPPKVKEEPRVEKTPEVPVNEEPKPEKVEEKTKKVEDLDLKARGVFNLFKKK